MLAMPLVLAKFLPGGGAPSEEARIALIAEQPWALRLGWLPWQLTAVVDLWFAWLVARTTWLPRTLRWLAAVGTLAAVIPDQLGQAQYVLFGPMNARLVVLGSNTVEQFLAWETPVFRMTTGWGATLYTLGTAFFLEAFRRARAWSRPLGIATAIFYLTMPVAAVAPLVALAGVVVPPKLVVVLNAIGFVVLLFVYALLAEAVLRRRIPDEAHGRWAPWRHPRGGLFGWLVDAVANSRFVFALTEPLPVFALMSDIEDVVYLNWLVNADRLEALVPPGLILDRVGPKKDKALFTALTFKHGHFGFRFLGGLRRFSPSAVQTNWRVHVREPGSGAIGIYFVTNAISFLPQALGARLFTEGMPMHLLAEAELKRDGDRITLRVAAGRGSAPDITAELERTGPEEGGLGAHDGALPPAFREVFPTYEAFLAYVVPQNCALATQPHDGTFTRQDIQLPIDHARVVPLRSVGEGVRSVAARAIVGDAEPFAFWVGKVAFSFSGEVKASLPRPR